MSGVKDWMITLEIVTKATTTVPSALGSLSHADNLEGPSELSLCKDYGVESGILEALIKCCGFVTLGLAHELREGLPASAHGTE